MRDCIFDTLSKRKPFQQLRKEFDEWTFAFLTFMMNFSKIAFSVCHSFRSTSQSGRMKGFKRCLQVFHQWCRCQQLNVHALMTMMHSRANNKPLLRRIEPRSGIIVPLFLKFEPRLGRIEPWFVIIKLVKALIIKPNLGNVFSINRKSAATELKAPLIDDTSVKTAVYLCNQSHITSSKNGNRLMRACCLHVWQLTIILRGRTGYRMIDNQRGA